jgi:hypothetical protein
MALGLAKEEESIGREDEDIRIRVVERGRTVDEDESVRV